MTSHSAINWARERTPGYRLRQLCIGDAEIGAVTVLQIDPVA